MLRLKWIYHKNVEKKPFAKYISHKEINNIALSCVWYSCNSYIIQGCSTSMRAIFILPLYQGINPDGDGLTHWGRVMHICVGKLTIIGSNNGLSPGRRQAIIWTNAGKLLIRPLGTNCSEILIGIKTFSFKKMYLQMSSAKWRPFYLSLNVLMDHVNILATDNISQQIMAQHTMCIFDGIYCMCSDSSIKPHYMGGGTYRTIHHYHSLRFYISFMVLTASNWTMATLTALQYVHFQMHFLVWKFVLFQNCIEVCS